MNAIPQCPFSTAYPLHCATEERSCSSARCIIWYGVNYWTFVNRFPKFSRHYDSPIYELSGGEARLAELYLVLHSDAPFYILDEPFTQVDPVNIEDVKAMILERAKDRYHHHRSQL